MCRMVGLVFSEQLPIEPLLDLRQVAEDGLIPGEQLRGHRDGWGFVSFISGSPRYYGRSPMPAYLDPSYDAALREMVKVRGPNIAIAHVRAASRGKPAIANTHPFIVDQVVLAHNGTVQGFVPKSTRRPRGDSDSELLAIALAERYDEKGDLLGAMRSLIKEELAGHEFSGLVLLASDGRSLVGYRDYAREDRAWYYDLKLARCGDFVMLYQESRMTYPGGTVTQVPKGGLVSVDLQLGVRISALA